MSITLKKLEEYKLEDFELIAKWHNDEEIKCFLTVNKQEAELEDVSGGFLLDKAKDNKSKYSYFILKEGSPIGVVTIIDKFPALTYKDDKTAWISICIGEKQYRGTGIGKEAMKLLENQCKELGYENIELGAFSLNHRALGFYKILGYEEIHVNEKITYYKGKWYDDIRMKKNI